MTLEFKILNKLLDKYERSKISKEQNKVKVTIFLSVSDDVFDGHRNNDNGELETILLRIKNDDYANIVYSRDGQFQKIELNTESTSINKLYAYLRRTNPKKTIEIFLAEFNKHLQDCPIVSSFAKAMIEFLDNKNLKKVESYVSSIEEINDISLAINEMEKLDSDIPERVFCAKLFSNSKRFNELRGKITKIIKEFSDEPFDEEDDVIALMGVIRNKSYAFIKGDIVLKVNNQIINLREYGEPLALSDSAINSLEVLSINCHELYTIENLTSFDVFDKKETTAIYLAGYHNKVKRQLILKIKEVKRDMDYYHYGDIDAGGFYILNHLRKKTGIAFKPYKMGIPELTKFKESCKSLTPNDRKRLENMMTSEDFTEFVQTIEFMLKLNIKLEQEAEN